jgi:hypothetical protein
LYIFGIYRTKTRKLEKQARRYVHGKNNNNNKTKLTQNVDLPVTLACKISVAMFRSLRASGELPVQKE